MRVQRAWAAVGVGPGELEGAQDAVLQGAAGYSVAVVANKQWCSGRPAVELIVAGAAAGYCREAGNASDETMASTLWIFPILKRRDAPGNYDGHDMKLGRRWRC